MEQIKTPEAPDPEAPEAQALNAPPASAGLFQGEANSAVTSHAAHSGLTGLTTGSQQPGPVS